MNNIKYSKTKIFAVVLGGIFLTAALIMAPKKINVAKSENCTNAPAVATLNFFPVTWESTAGFGCTDFAPIAVRNTYETGYVANDYGYNGDELYVRIYVHNGAQQGLDPQQTTANNVSGSVNISGNTISTVFAGSNTNSVSGSVNIDIPEGSRLEMVPGSGEFFDYQANPISGSDNLNGTSGNFSFGDMPACFEYSKFFRFKVKVVGQAVTGSNTISANPGGQIGSQCLRTGSVSWTNASNVQSVEVTVQNISTNSAVNSLTGPQGGTNSSSETNWLTPGDTFSYVMYDTTGGRHDEIARTTENVPALECGGEEVVNPSGSISVNITGKIPNQCLSNASVTWSANNVSGALVTMTHSSDNYASVGRFAYSSSGTQNANWIAPGETFRFTLWEINPTSGGQNITDREGVVWNVKMLDQKSIVGPALECGGEEVVNPSGSISVNITGKIPNQCLSNASVTWSANNVSGALVTMTHSSDNYASVGRFAYSSSGTQNANWIAPGETFRFTLWEINPTSGGQNITDREGVVWNVKMLDQKSIVGPALECGSVYEDVVCSASPSIINAGQSVQFTANKGDGNYVWEVTGGSVTHSSQKTFSSTFNTPGAYLAQVVSNGKQATCSVQVEAGACVINSNFAINATTAVKTGATYKSTVTWSSTGNNQIKIVKINPDGTSENFFTGNNTGSKYAENLKASSTYIFRMYDAACNTFLTSIQVVTPSNPQTLSCSADNSSYNIGETAAFRASGGGSTYTWSNGGSPANGSGVTFNTVFSTAGVKTVGVLSADGQTANCSTVINTPVVNKGVINLTKEVKSISENEVSYSHSTSAKQNNIVEYRIKVWAGTSVNLKDVVVTDTFASGLEYVEGSLKVNGQSHSTGLSNSGLTFATVTGEPVIIIYRAKVTVSVGSLVNTARATAGNADNSASDQAVVNVSYVNPGQPSLSITKQVKNLSQGTGYASSVSAKKGETVKYQVVIRNIGQATANNVYFNDSNPSGVQPLRYISAAFSNSTTRDFSGLGQQGILLGNLTAGSTVTITYEGTVNIESGTINNVATVSADNATSQNSSATVVVSSQTIPGGNYNYCVNYSCNVTNTYSYSYNNYVYITGGQTVPASQYTQLGITKNVRNYSSGAYSNSVSANNGDTVQFEIVVTNTGNTTANNVRMNDNLSSGLSLVSGTLTVDGSYISDNNLSSGIYLGSLSVGQQKRINFQARVNSSSNTSIQNNASAYADNVSTVQDDAWVFVNNGTQGGNVSLTYSKKAINETRNADASSVTALREDYITYTLTVSNNGNTPANNFAITDDLSQVLPYADMVDNGGGTVSGNVITFPGITVPAYGSVTKSFKVRVKYSLSENLTYTMSNTYGNTITIRINTPKVLGAFVAPKTGADTAAFAFSGLLTAGAVVFRRRKEILKLIFT